MAAGAEIAFALLGGEARRGAWRARLFCGYAGGLEGGGGLEWDGPRWAVRLLAGMEILDWEIDQAFSSRRYLFSFPLRREYLSLSALPGSAQRARLPSLTYRREVLVGRERGSGDWNDAFVLQQGAELRWPARGDARLRGSYGSGRLSVGMYADETRYLSLPRLRYRHHDLDFRLFARRGPGELWLGVEEAYLLSEGDPWFEPWPFSFWLVFKNTRYRLEALDYRLTIWSLGYAREFSGARWNMRARLRHLWCVGGGAVIGKERVQVFPPFFFDWEARREVLALPAISMLRLDMEGGIALSRRLRLRWGITQLAPLRKIKSAGKPGPAMAPEPSGYTYGGLRARLGLEIGG